MQFRVSTWYLAENKEVYQTLILGYLQYESTRFIATWQYLMRCFKLGFFTWNFDCSHVCITVLYINWDVLTLKKKRRSKSLSLSSSHRTKDVARNRTRNTPSTKTFIFKKNLLLTNQNCCLLDDQAMFVWRVLFLL
jgi:hypothetical protein